MQIRKMMQKEVILLVDNRLENQYSNKSKIIDFRSSAFKQTQIDPLQPRPDFTSLNQQDQIILTLRKRVSELQKRVVRLESQNTKEMNSFNNCQGELKKKRRKFSELSRNFKCSHSSCQKLYGSQTSLKNHLKLKHCLEKQNY